MSVKKFRVKNPDRQKTYRVWHYCPVHKVAFRHSQAERKLHKNCKFLTFPIEQEEIEVEIVNLEFLKHYKNIMDDSKGGGDNKNRDRR